MERNFAFKSQNYSKIKPIEMVEADYFLPNLLTPSVKDIVWNLILEI